MEVDLSSYLKSILSKHSGNALAIWGEAGIGKTFAVKGLLRHLPCQTLSLHATEPLIHLVTSLPRVTKLPLWAESTLKRLIHQEPTSPKESFTALTMAISGLAPIVLYFEDYHEAETPEFINHLALNIKKLKGVGLIITTRTEPPQFFRAIRLEPLSYEASCHILEQELNAKLPEAALAWIFARAAGNPLFSLEYFRYLARQGYIWNDSSQWYWREPSHNILPITIEALIEMQISKVVKSSHSNYLLESKAMLPAYSKDSWITKVAGLTEAEYKLAQKNLQKLGILTDRGFVHPLFGEVTLKSINPERKKLLARRILDSFADNPEFVLAYLDTAQLANSSALKLLQEAEIKLKPEQQHLSSQIVEKASQYSKGKEKGDLALKAARLRLKSGDAYIDTLLKIADEYLPDKTLSLLTQAEAQALRGERLAVKETLKQLSPEHINHDWLIRCLFTAGDHAELGLLLPTFDLSLLNDSSIYYLAWVLMDKGSLEQALVLAEERLSRKDLSAEGKAELLDIRASVLHYQGKYKEADPWFTEVANLYKEAHSGWDGVANALRNRALNRLEMGMYKEVIPDFQAALSVYAERGANILYAQTQVMMSYVYYELGEYSKAEDVLLESIKLFEQVDLQPFYLYALANIALLYLEQESSFGRILAHKYAQKALSLAPQLQSSLFQATALNAAAEVARQKKSFVEATDYAETALALANNAGLIALAFRSRLILARVEGDKENYKKALALLENASEIAKQSNMALDEKKTQLELARLAKDSASARKLKAWFKEYGFMHSVHLVHKYFPQLSENEAAPAITAITPTQLRLEVLGKMQVVQNGQYTSVQGRKRQDCLVLLLENKLSGKNDLSQLELIDALYPEKTEAAALTALKQLIHQIRSSYGETLILSTANGYSLGEVNSDAAEFLETGNTALWQGHYAGQTSSSSLTETLYDALFECARALLTENPTAAKRLLKLVLEANPYHKQALKNYLSVLQQSADPRTIKRIYNEARIRFAELDEHLAESWQTFIKT